MKTYLQGVIVLAALVGVPTSLFGQQSVPQASSQPAPTLAQVGEASTDLAALLNAGGGRSIGWPWLEQDSRTVFVVPKPDLPLDALAAITEDMTVMCRILDKLMLQAALIVPAPDTLDPFGRATAESYMQPQGLYLDGYGAVFFVEVEFPLAPGPQGQGQPKTEPSADTLWSQTADELKGITQNQDAAIVQEYDAQKVENLKKVLVKSLRHAANMRMPGTQEQVTVVAMARISGNSTGSAARFRVEPSASERANVLVFRTAKADVDAFARGTLTLEQFTEKVRILPSWARSRQQAAPSTGLALPSSGSSTNVRR